MGKSRGGGRRLARVLAQPATSRDGWVEAQSGRARAGGEAEVVSGLRPGADSQGRGHLPTPSHHVPLAGVRKPARASGLETVCD